MITTDGEQMTITYSPIKIEEYATDLYFSEYIEGSSNNKAIEIYNGTSGDIDLSDYSIELYSNDNAGPTPTDSLTLSGTLAQGDVYVISDSSANAEISAVSDTTSAVCSFNGNDAIVLKKGTVKIDIIGIEGGNVVWNAGDGTTEDHTLVRSSNISGPNTTFSSSEWIAYDIDTFNYLGYHDYETPTSVSISETNPIQIADTGTVNLSASYTLENADPKIIWASSNESIASIDENGLVTGLYDGFVIITLYSYYDHSVNDSITIIVGNYDTYSVTYEENGGSAVLDELVVPSGGYATEPDPAPTLDGYAFSGWFTDDGTFLNQFDFRYDTIIENTTLYAKWTKLPDLFISEYGEPNGGVCKYIEIYNPTNSIIDLTQYSVAKSTDGAVLPSTGDFDLSSTIVPGQAIVLGASACIDTGDEAQTEGNPPFPTSGITFVIWTSATWNGNDPIGLYKNDVLIDKIGAADGTDPGTNWAVGDGNITDGNTLNTILIRIPSVIYGETDWAIGAQQWLVSPDNKDYSNVGIHTTSFSGPDMTAPIITITDVQRYFSIGDPITYECTAIDYRDPSVTCYTTDSVDTQTLGTYTVDYIATDESGNTAIKTATYIVYPAGDPLTWNLETYYDDVENLSGSELEAALTIIVNNGFTGVNYDAARITLDDTDADPDIPGNLILVYLQISRDGTWDAGAIGTWNREHVFPQSLLGVSANGSTVNAASDLHNLKPSDPQENSSRGNSYFTYDSLGLTDTYEPPDEVKGDIARILFYMTVMYNNGSYDLELVDGIPGLYEMGDLATLLEWNDLDPVDAFEQARNDAIFGIQGNYNPFIDYPHFAELIWGDHPYYN
jgi:uncharacterized repeat protein (TIGR02543 family)